VGARRTGPLIAILALIAAALIARLYQVQVVEHATWAEEARKLVRSGALLPYERGALADATGQVLVADTVRYQVELEYREFRRGHPLGQIAHGRAALEMRDVGLLEARGALLPWGRALVALGPHALLAFARGGALVAGDVRIAATDDPEAERRANRASDLRFYAQRLLDLSRAETRALRAVETERGFRASYLEWAAAARGRTPAEELARLERRWLMSVEHLEFLGLRLASEAGVAGVLGLDRLIDEIEGWRIAVDNAAAGRLFREVAGFRAGRLEPAALLGWLDLEWLAREMRWDAPRLAEFAAQERAGWLLSWRDGFALPRLLAELRLDRDGGLDADRALATLAAVYGSAAAFQDALDGAPRDWREAAPVPVIDDLARVLELDAPRGFEPAPLAPPWRAAGLQSAAQTRVGEARWELLEHATGAGAADVEAALVLELGVDGFERNFGGDLAGLWRTALGGSVRHRAANRARIDRAARALLDAWEVEFQRLVEARLLELSTLPAPARRRDARMRFGPDRLDRLGERARHLVKDYGSRRAVIGDRPSYEVVYLLTREPERYPGFLVHPARDRSARLDGDETHLPGAELIGLVAGVDAERLQRQRQDAARFRELRAKASRSAEETRHLRALMGELLFVDERRGVSGIEGYADAQLRGRNGYRERLGLEDVFGRGAHAIQLAPVEDGRDVRLSLRRDLQAAAERAINHPLVPPAGVPADPDWLRAPVGAIVLLSKSGDVLAAASAPNAAALGARDPDRPGARAIERTLSQPGFQPIGSVFKPFVALHALEHHRALLLGPAFAHVCAVPEGLDHAEWGGVRCHSRWGHGPVDLARALEVSCNTYFAHVADLLAPEDLAALAHAVGFGEATGVEDLGPGSARIETVPKILVYEPRMDLRRQMRRGTNGLQVLDGTPMQVARAFWALAYGALPDLRLVQSVGGVELERPPAVRLPYSEAVLGAVRRYLVRVAAGVEGSARVALDPLELGWIVAAKTGSADLASRRSATDELGPDGDPRQPKHTWIAGWLPADDPQLVFCVFVNDTLATASHSAAWIARGLLLEPEVVAYLAACGAPRDADVLARVPTTSSHNPWKAPDPSERPAAPVGRADVGGVR